MSQLNTDKEGNALVEGNIYLEADKTIYIDGEPIQLGGGLVNAPDMIIGSTPASSVVIDSSEGLLDLQAGGGAVAIELDASGGVISLTAVNGLKLNGLAIIIGANDSAGAGFRSFKIANIA